jgi:hypothetical protein
MMADRPLLGFGWGEPESSYDHYYRSIKLDEGMAIQLNDFFTSGMSAGLPVLLCFGAYVVLSLTQGAGRMVREDAGRADTVETVEVETLPAPTHPPFTQLRQGVNKMSFQAV